jgi:TonB family protein
MTSADATSTDKLLADSGNAWASAHAAWVRLAPALLISVAVHAAAITSLDRYAAPLGRMQFGQAGHILTVALAPRSVQHAGDGADNSEAPNPERARRNKTRPPESDTAVAPHGMPLATYFFARDEVDQPATAISDVLLRYPPEAFAAGTHGQVILEVFVDAGGSVVRTSVVESTPHGVFESAAQDAIGQLRYRPAQRAGAAVRSRRLVQVVFDPNPPLLPPRATQGPDRPDGDRQGKNIGVVSDG